MATKRHAVEIYLNEQCTEKEYDSSYQLPDVIRPLIMRHQSGDYIWKQPTDKQVQAIYDYIMTTPDKERFEVPTSSYGYEIIYEDMLDAHNKLEIRYCPIDEWYIWRIRFLDKNGNDYGSESNGEWHFSQAACEADARVHFLMERQSDND